MTMDLLAELLLGIEALIALMSIPLFVLSRRTSRTKYARHQAFQSVSIFFLGVASLAALVAVYGLGTSDHVGYLLAVLIPILTFGLCTVVIIRASQANSISHQRRRHY